MDERCCIGWMYSPTIDTQRNGTGNMSQKLKEYHTVHVSLEQQKRTRMIVACKIIASLGVLWE